MYNTSQKLVAEFLGTFALVFFGAGAICAERFLQGAGGGVLGGALASGLAIAILSVAFSHVSGAHFNPAVTVGFWITKRLSTLEVLGYWLAQIFGGIFAAFILKAILPRDEAWQPALASQPPPCISDATSFVPRNGAGATARNQHAMRPCAVIGASTAGGGAWKTFPAGRHPIAS